MTEVPNSIAEEDSFKDLGLNRLSGGSSGSDEFRFLFSGSLVRNKGIDILVKNWEWLTNGSKRKILLDVAGTGPLANELRMDAPANVVFHGHLEAMDYRKVFEAASGFILPSHADRNPLVVVEALWAALPLIVTEGVGSWPEAVGANGSVVKLEDLSSLRRAIQELASMSGEEYLQVSRESSRRAELFSTDRAVSGFRSAIKYAAGV